MFFDVKNIAFFFGGRTEAAGSEKMEQFGDRMKSVWVAKTALWGASVGGERTIFFLF